MKIYDNPVKHVYYHRVIGCGWDTDTGIYYSNNYYYYFGKVTLPELNIRKYRYRTVPTVRYRT